jgi:oxalate decarboxylase/phosphoglucose isomerase-like protein (cupin superfamily)
MSTPLTAPLLAGNIIGSVADSFVIAEWQDRGGPPGPPRLIAPLHLHHRDDEAWYVLEGVLRIQRGDDVVEARAGSAVLVPRGTPHTYWNPGPERTRYLLIMTANIYAMIQAIHALSQRTPATMRELFAKYDSELL